MPESDLETRVEELEDAVKVYSDQIKALKDDLDVVIAMSNVNLVSLVRQQTQRPQAMSNWANAPELDPAFAEKCRRFVERYEAGVRG